MSGEGRLEGENGKRELNKEIIWLHMILSFFKVDGISELAVKSGFQFFHFLGDCIHLFL